MKTLATACLTLTALLTVGCISPQGDSASEKRQHVDDAADKTIEMVVQDKDNLTKQEVMDAVGYAAITNIGTQLLLLGADDGYGVLVDNSSGERTYLNISGVDFGPGVGIAKYRTLILFEDKEKMDRFKKGHWEFGGGVAAVAKTGGGSGGSAEDAASFDKDVDVYITGEDGLAVAANIRGMNIKVNKELNSK